MLTDLTAKPLIQVTFYEERCILSPVDEISCVFTCFVPDVQQWQCPLEMGIWFQSRTGPPDLE